MSGDVTIGVIDSLPFDGIHLLLGNNIVSDKVKVNPILTDKPSQQRDPAEHMLFQIYIHCAPLLELKKKRNQMRRKNYKRMR